MLSNGKMTAAASKLSSGFPVLCENEWRSVVFSEWPLVMLKNHILIKLAGALKSQCGGKCTFVSALSYRLDLQADGLCVRFLVRKRKLLQLCLRAGDVHRAPAVISSLGS